MELLLKSAEINLPQSIANLEALKAELQPKLEKYNNLVVTADSIKEAKADKAVLNKLKTTIEDQRKAIKKQYLEPYNVLENQCKEVVALIDAPITAIDKQIKAFDEIEENGKYSELSVAFESLDAPEWITLDSVLNPKWRNKTMKIDTLISEIKGSVKILLESLEKINQMYGNEPYLLSITEFFKTHKDFSKTAVYAAQMRTAYEKEKHEKLKAQMLAAAAEEEQNKRLNASEQPATANNDSIPVQDAEAEKAPLETASDSTQKVYKGKFEVETTGEKLKALAAYMKENGIKYKVIK